ncbi:sporulation protein Cse60 [Heyndrickxia camelliae]|uniref:Uncharacterized protein n=1 Tax=Heyndrickxia camelliae TaxID=1707093 RepID=A0A2N3LG38_9BACI|nr:sporulation protein Cse60 [Heyndrickxia camelliae]PKR83514.1 hypothetical protein CWO92_18280 [Heyndrickxia camelliae]
MLKTKLIYASTENYGKPNSVYRDIDFNINKFIDEENIDESNLIDIKYSLIGYFHNEEGQLEGSALIVYRK